MLFLMANHGSSRVKSEHELIVNTSDTVVVEYTYDAWGRLLTTTGSMASTLGEINPLRYRGYVYDTETGLYYLESRYYNPNIGRFINADVFTSTGQGFIGCNMFAYCGNNPVSRYDPSGKIFFTVLGAIVGAVTGFIDAQIMGTDPMTGLTAGAVSGAISGAGVDIGVLITAGSGGTLIGWGVAAAGGLGALGSAVGTGISSDWTAEPNEYIGAAIVGGGMNIISFGTAPINGEIPKAGLRAMMDMVVYDGVNNLTENAVMSTIIAVGTTWIIRAGQGIPNHSPIISTYD